MGNLYETDFYAWTQAQADTLRRGEFQAADLSNLIEEIETMGRGEKRELINRMVVLLTHLLKWQHQFLLRGNSWRRTINEQRRQIEMVLEESPSLAPSVPHVIARAYVDAVKAASDETGIKPGDFPGHCAYSQEQILTDFWFPDTE